MLCSIYLRLVVHNFAYFFLLMIRRPPRSTRTDTLFPYTTLFRSHIGLSELREHRTIAVFDQRVNGAFRVDHDIKLRIRQRIQARGFDQFFAAIIVARATVRSEERSVGKECVSRCKSRWPPSHHKHKKYARDSIAQL